MQHNSISPYQIFQALTQLASHVPMRGEGSAPPPPSPKAQGPTPKENKAPTLKGGDLAKASAGLNKLGKGGAQTREGLSQDPPKIKGKAVPGTQVRATPKKGDSPSHPKKIPGEQGPATTPLWKMKAQASKKAGVVEGAPVGCGPSAAGEPHDGMVYAAKITMI